MYVLLQLLAKLVATLCLVVLCPVLFYFSWAKDVMAAEAAEVLDVRTPILSKIKQKQTPSTESNRNKVEDDGV